MITKFASIFIIILIVFLMPPIHAFDYYKGPKSDHFDGKVFHNKNPQYRNTKNLWDLIKWKVSSKREAWPENIKNEIYDIPPSVINDGKLRISFVGHATVLIQVAGLNILTDPLWSKRASPISWAGPKRVIDPGIKMQDLPKIDVILISHNHYDHLDLATLTQIYYRDKPRIITTLGNDQIIMSHDKNISCEAYDWDEYVFINNNVKIHIEEAVHWSARGIFDHNKALWCAFTIETKDSGNIYFAGDTAYVEGQHFLQARKKHKNFRLALIPIGAFEPRWFMKDNHMNPEDAILAFKDLNAQNALGIHYATFPLADESYEAPGKQIDALRKTHNISADKFRLIDVGQNWYVD